MDPGAAALVADHPDCLEPSLITKIFFPASHLLPFS